MHLTVLFLLLFAACGEEHRPRPEDASVLARVGDAQIGAERLDRAVEALYPPGEPRPPDSERRALERLIDLEVLVLGALDKGLENDWQVQNQIRQKEQELILDELFRRGVLHNAEGVSSEEAREYFERYRIGEERRLSRILVNGPAAVSRVLARLNAGEDFAQVAGELSEDGKTAASGGDLGWMSRLSFKSHLLRRQIFDAAVGQVIGPVQEPDGYALLMVTDVRQSPFENMAAVVEKAMLEQKRALDTFKYLEGLAASARIEENAQSLQVLLQRLSEAGQEMPQLKTGEGRQVLFTLEGQEWTLDHFMAAMLSERDQAEIRSIDDLRQYARRLYALKILLPRRARELGIHQTERVSSGLERTRNEALMERLRQIEVVERFDPSDEELRVYYEAHKDVYVRTERISILEVLVDSREQAEALLVEVEKGGDLDELARRYSRRSPRIRRAGGRVQLLRPDKYGKVGWEAQEARIGEIVGPVKTGQGYSIFKVIDKTPGRQHSFEEVKPQVRSHLRQERVQQGMDELLARLRQRFAGRIEVYEDRVQAYLQTRQKS